MKIAVTGASGFVGSHVLTELQRHEVEIVAITRSANRLAGVDSKVRVVELDIADADAACYERIGQPDVLVHLAWDGLPNYRALHHFETELPRQYRFLKQLVEAGLPTLVVTGTCLEYGMQCGLLSENMPPCPVTSYGYAKDALRRQLEFLQGSHSLHLVWARLFYMFGLGQPGSSLFSQLQSAVSRRDQEFNMSGGEQLRDYLPVEEVARLLTRLALLQPHVGIVNVCSGEPISVRLLVERWLGETCWDIHLNLGRYPYNDYEPMAFWGDRSKLDRVLTDEDR
jgi:dTDP-6-deoxy-L-talose 4-dehydrogenase (NAD+)